MAAFLRVSACVLFIVPAGCGGGSPTAPPAPSVPTLQTITVTTLGGDLLFLGQGQSFRASGTMSNGEGRDLSGGAWSVSPEALGGITAAGQLTAQASGMATVAYAQDGRSGSTQIRTLPNYARRFVGTLTYQTCTEQNGAPQNSCLAYDIGKPQATAFEVAQTRDTVFARLGWGSSVSDSFSAGIALNGSVVLQAQLTDASSDSAITARYELNCPTASNLVGTITFTISHPKTQSLVILSGTIEGSAALALLSSMARSHASVLPGG